MKGYNFLVPPNHAGEPLQGGVVDDRVVEGLYLCFFGNRGSVGHLISVDAMLQQGWEFFNDPKVFLQRVQQLTPKPEVPEPRTDAPEETEPTSKPDPTP